MTDRRPPPIAGPEALDRETVLGAVLASVALREVAPGRYEGPNVVLPGYGRLFGGQLLAQGLAAAQAIDPTGKVARSLHLVFTAEGRPDDPVQWSAAEVHSGRSFATRAVTALQGEVVLATGTVSLHRGDGTGIEHRMTAPHAVADGPESLPGVPQLGAMALEMRPVDGVALDGLEVGPPELSVWMRLPEQLPPAHTAEVLAYSSDLTMMAAALRPHPGVGFGAAALAASAVTSHTISFHCPLPAAGWLLFDQSSPVAAGGRAYIRGDWFTETGDLVASCAQEVTVRLATDL